MRRADALLFSSYAASVTHSQSRAISHEPSVTKLTSGQLQKDVLQIGMPMQIAHVVAPLELVHQRIGIARVAKNRFAGLLAPLAQRFSERLRPAVRAFPVDLDDLRLDVAFHEIARRAAGDV